MIDTSGCMKKYATSRSRMVEMPRKNAKPRTEPIARTVQHDGADQRHEVGGDDRPERAREPAVDTRTDGRPPRTSSFSRSKYTT